MKLDLPARGAPPPTIGRVGWHVVVNLPVNALQVHLTKRKGNVVMTLNYTWCHALADSSGNYNGGEDAGARRINEGAD